jgi:hypothetical protein
MSKEIKQICKQIKKEFLKKDLDFILIIVGGEGSGKSNCGFCFDDEIDPFFSISNVVFSREQHDTANDCLPPGSVLDSDEGVNVICKSETNKGVQINTVKKITMSRYKRLFRVYKVSDPNTLHKYLVRHRLQERNTGVIHITERGKFEWLTRKAINLMRKKLLTASLEFSWTDIKGKTIRGTFENYEKIYPEFSKAYRKKKEKAIENIGKEKPTKSRLTKSFIIRTELKNGLKVSEVSKKWGFDIDYCYQELNSLRHSGELTK